MQSNKARSTKVSLAWETQEGFMEKMHLAEVTSGCEWALPAGKAGYVRHQQLRYLGTCKVYRETMLEKLPWVSSSYALGMRLALRK